jgi:hypothetical protein
MPTSGSADASPVDPAGGNLPSGALATPRKRAAGERLSRLRPRHFRRFFRNSSALDERVRLDIFVTA